MAAQAAPNSASASTKPRRGNTRARGRAAARNNPIAQNRRTRQLDKLRVQQGSNDNSSTNMENNTVRRFAREQRLAATNQNSPLQLKRKKEEGKKGVLSKMHDFVRSIKNKGKIATHITIQTPALLWIYGVIAAISLVSLLARYFIGDGTLTETVIEVFVPISGWLLATQAAAAVIGISCVMASYFSLLFTMTNIFRAPVLIPFLMAVIYYGACIALPILGLFPVVIIWLWLVVLFI